MALYINTNVASLNAQRRLNQSTTKLSGIYQKLSSGLRVNSAKDDAAGLSISTRMTAQVRGLNMAARNANDGISLAQVAEGALEETTNALQRMRELAVQAANGTMTTSDRDDLHAEFAQLVSEIDRIAHTTSFNGKVLMSTAGYSAKIQVGAYSGQMISFVIKAATANALAISALTISGTGPSRAASAISTLDLAINSITDIRATLGAMQNRFEAVVSNLSNQSEQMSAARSRILDADIAFETAQLTQQSILQQAGTAILAQANQQPSLALQLLG
ncbi:flagellin [Magnetofaba australis]|uniref:Flagellin n=1 Tax=Magnetofaba australis IT-1 TaxID=1434232 RepID=A0A1Y2K671_9PROT|nr:flagellin [Magnetofaba australis]OSM03930.1 putative flagellin domain-containing protein [Magnetofaba australis IT-1]OSM03931.1 putative flagellin domain-containing protein [Magnetofaba australis IT-1]